MLSELNESKRFLIEKYGSFEKVKPGTYAIPFNTSKGPAFMKIVISTNMCMSNFGLYIDKELTKKWQG
ncbi:hypothetical protein [Chryseobacterium indologenes]|uniref:Uncharacterized protein n=1 Tax=Chryseobacterium indologenes TaxID=253 RepID=A0A0N0IV16_CHRID|nr:hypothetical protein [Chryseobacterium indologenes]KPE50131.1 hypothetical protein AOB46_16975 [Chryseobacterium indologenes]